MSLFSSRLLSGLDDVSRRQLIVNAAKTCLGVSLLPLGLEEALAAETKNAAPAAKNAKAGSGKTYGSKPRAKHLIYLFMGGAMSHLDTFDPKPKSKVQGETKPVQTKIAGVQFGEFLPGLAQAANHLAVINSLNTTTADHNAARYLISTSFKPIATTQHPGLGSWIHKFLGRMHKELPVAVHVGGGGVGPGYLGAEFAPVPIGDPSQGLQNTKSPAYLTNDAFDKRMQLSSVFDNGFRNRAKSNRKVNGYDDLYHDAIGLLRSEDLKAFDINQEPEDQKKAYGDSRFGKGVMLARRLVENGVRYVEVSLGSWDHHYELWDKLPGMCADLDKVVSHLLKDLESRGLLKDTLVVIGTEFGRKPEINQNSGRDHHPAAFSAVLAGGPIKGGQVWGKSDENAFYVEKDGVSIEDFNSTIAAAMGIPHDVEIHSPDGRPFTLGNHGKPVEKLFA